MSIRDEIAKTIRESYIARCMEDATSDLVNGITTDLLARFPWMRDEPSEEEVDEAAEAAWQSSLAHRGPGGQTIYSRPWQIDRQIKAALVAARKVRDE